ncbi:hypothetical protein GWI33_013050 [Rhynchophorus ferrugineus]|uniref:Uncharacterized protein n=1 Tax=Rhynchophorus ferrugineus TaxID=354439 RepID=A0A834I7Z2_RHYFE|nr:hypothetical protein GWI33_013050 [Rhynchophorus ferrugineus]
MSYCAKGGPLKQEQIAASRSIHDNIVFSINVHRRTIIFRKMTCAYTSTTDMITKRLMLTSVKIILLLGLLIKSEAKLRMIYNNGHDALFVARCEAKCWHVENKGALHQPSHKHIAVNIVQFTRCVPQYHLPAIVATRNIR